jgi:gluconate 2-dehydrogenase gamma chain
MTAHELRTLRALTARLLPGPPEDPDPGALEAGAAEAIELLLDAFDREQPPIHAAQEGGFVPLDSVAELGWRIRLEGSRGSPEREFAGPVTGLAQLIAEGLALLDDRSREASGLSFADVTASDQDALLDTDDERVAAFVRLVLMMTLDAVYGPPHYGANRDGAGWKRLGWPGFTQPRGFTAAQVSEPDAGATASGEALTDLGSSLEAETGWQLGSE